MKTRYILLAAALLAASACSKDASQTGMLTFTAWNEGSADTKATVKDGGTKVFWEPGDAIKVFYGEDANKFESQCTGLEAVTTFTGQLNIIGGANEGATFDSNIWGLYPYRLDATSDGESVTTTLPSSQSGRAGGFAQNTNITLARSTGFGLAFYNVCGGIRFSLTKSGIKRVVLESVGGEPVAGVATVTMENGLPKVTGVSDGSSKITLQAPSGESFAPGEWYYIVALPGSLSQGFKLTFRSETGTGTLTCSKPVTIKRGVFGTLADVDSGVEISAGGGDEGDDVNIEIDGEFWDWASVPAGLSSTSGPYLEFKAVSDANYLYFYSKRTWHDELWKDSSGGYFYYELDTDNDPSTGTNSVNGNTGYGVEYWMFLYLFTGSSSTPTFANTPKGSAYPSSSVIANILAAGATDRSVVEVEVRVPRSNVGLTSGGTIRIYTWGNKSAGNLKSASSYLTLTVK
ncbi:MAG: hypothetical protein J6X71_01950 [Bacteroidales bacterium]|nr:hypothetical protein [Bacteroidales bacterium]